jgi:3-dehydroquinate synthase
MKTNKKVKTAIILAAGSGNRLDIFETPKPVVRLNNKSLIMHAIDMFRDEGVDNFFVITKPGDKLIRKELIDIDGINYVEKERDSKGMLGSILEIKNIIDSEKLKDDFYVSMCDLCFSENPIKYFDENGHDGISVLVSPDTGVKENSGAQERVIVSQDRIGYDSTEIEKNSNAHEAGIYRFTLDAYNDFLSSVNHNTKTVHQVFGEYSKTKNILPVEMSGDVWFDINEPVDLVRAELFLRNNTEVDTKKINSIAKNGKAKAITSYEHNKKIKYDVVVERNIIERLDEYEIIPHEFYYSPHFLVVDRNIDELYGEKIYRQFKKMGYIITKILVDPGEASKSIDMYAKLGDEMVTRGIDKKSVIISVGGGVVKDLAGFLASTIYRGINFISFPTTVLSQSDAAIALKQGVNGHLGKNLFGSYYDPICVIVDPATLLTLEDRYIYDGLAECLKQSFAQDTDFYKLFKNYKGEVRDIDFLEEVVTKAATLKVDSTSRDYKEENIALVNQYGHEFGHAIEHLSGYTLLHGEAVAVGMRVSAELSKILKIANQDTADKQIELMQKYHLPVTIPANIKAEDVLNSLRFSKKFHGNMARFVLVDKIGSIWHDEDYYFVTTDDKTIVEAVNNSYDL